MNDSRPGRSLLLLSLLFLWKASVAHAAPAASSAGGSPVIASVLSVEGTVMVKAAGKSVWTVAKPQMGERADDHIKTDAGSVAALEFVCGGRVGISPSTEVELVAPRSARDVGAGTTLKVTGGSIWATMTPQSAPFKVVTPSCTLGIRGTEFVVEDSGEQTEISVLSGAVEVTDAENVVTVVRPGQVLRARRRARATLRKMGLGPMRPQLRQRLRRLRRHLDGLPPGRPVRTRPSPGQPRRRPR